MPITATRHDRVRGGERQLRLVDAVVDDVADELARGAADEQRRDVVAERQREREDRAGDDARQRERQDHAAQRPAAVAAEIARRLDVGVGDPLERRVDRQDHERQPDVGEDEPDGDVRVADVRGRQPELLQRPVEDAVVVEDQPPRVDAREVARPERQQHEHEERRADARRREPRHEVRERERDDRVGDRHRGGDRRSCARRSCGRRRPPRAAGSSTTSSRGRARP